MKNKVLYGVKVRIKFNIDTSFYTVGKEGLVTILQEKSVGQKHNGEFSVVKEDRVKYGGRRKRVEIMNNGSNTCRFMSVHCGVEESSDRKSKTRDRSGPQS